MGDWLAGEYYYFVNKWQAVAEGFGKVVAICHMPYLIWHMAYGITLIYSDNEVRNWYRRLIFRT
jgi:hypothetical protein